MKEAIPWACWTETQEVQKGGMIGKKAVKEEVVEIVAKRKRVITEVMKIEERGVGMVEIEIAEIAETIEIAETVGERIEKEKI